MIINGLDDKPRGRPRKITNITLAKLEEAFALGCTDEEACVFAGIGCTTLYAHQKDDPSFISRKELLKNIPFYIARKAIIAALPDNPELALKYMERKKKEEFSLRTETDHTGTIKFEPVRFGDAPVSVVTIPEPLVLDTAE